MKMFEVRNLKNNEVHVLDELQLRKEAEYYYNNSEVLEAIDFSVLQNCIDFINRIDEVKEIEIEIKNYYKTPYWDQEFTIHFIKFKLNSNLYKVQVFEDENETYIHTCFSINNQREVEIVKHFGELSHKVFTMVYEAIEEDYQGEF